MIIYSDKYGKDYYAFLLALLLKLVKSLNLICHCKMLFIKKYDEVGSISINGNSKEV